MLHKHVVLLSVLLFVFLILGLSLRNNTILTLSIPLAIFALVGFFYWAGQSKPNIQVKRTLNFYRVNGGENVDVQLQVSNHGPASEQLWIQDMIPLGLELMEGDPSVVVNGNPGMTILNYQVKAPRGIYEWQRVTVSTQAHLSAGYVEQHLPCETSLLSLPQGEPAGALVMAARRTRVYSGLVPAKRGGEGLEFFDTRPYTPGDEIRRIHWKATARSGDWITTQFEQERIADVAIVVDARRKSNVDYCQFGPAETHSLFEKNIRAGASVAEIALAQGNRVGMLIYGRALEWTYPGYGKVQRERIFQQLAQADLGQKAVFEGLDHLPQKLFPLRSQLIVITSLLNEDVDVLKRLQARGYALTVISPNPVLFEANHIADSKTTKLAVRLAKLERNQRLQELRRGRVNVVDWDTNKPLNPQMMRAMAWVKR